MRSCGFLSVAQAWRVGSWLFPEPPPPPPPPPSPPSSPRVPPSTRPPPTSPARSSPPSPPRAFLSPLDRPPSFGCNVSRNSHSRATRPDDPESLQGVCLLQPHPLQLDLVPLDSTDQCSFIVLKFSRPKESFGTDSTSLEVSPWEAKEKTKPHCIQTAERAGKMGKGRRLVISKDPSTPKRNLAASLSQTEHERVTGSLAVKVRCHCCGEGCCCGLGSIPGPLTSTCLRNG